jgi:multidrug efflux pump subunit AcrA (membrane-fusion protein)
MSETAPINHADYDRTLRQAIMRKERIRELEASLAAREKTIGEMKASLDAATKSAADLTGRVQSLESNPGELQSEVDRLRGELRSRDYRARFEKLVREHKGEKGETVNPSAIDALWKLAGITPDSDEPDEGKIKEAMGAAVAANPFVLQAPDASTGGKAAVAAGTTTTPAPAGPGVVRGGADVSKPTTTADAITAKFEAARGLGANPFRLA